jgi:rubrerythrin
VKVTKELKKKMRELKKKGMNYAEIAKALSLHPSTVEYHLSRRRKRKVLEKVLEYAKRPEYQERHKEYLKQYIKRRLKEDEGFKKKFYRAIERYHEKIRERNSSIKVPDGKMLKCVYCGHTWVPKDGVVSTNCPSCKRLLVKLPEMVDQA